jgi:hypothetical protein
MRPLVLYHDYTREEVHDLFDPESTFTPQAGTWGLQGIVEIPRRPRDYVFFVTFGKTQAAHEFDEGITHDGILRWQSQPKQRLLDRTIQSLITHDEDINSIYLFLRTAARMGGIAPHYTYLGRLKYLVHDHDREQPVYFTWKILDWSLSDEIRKRMNLMYEGSVASGPGTLVKGQIPGGLMQVPGPGGPPSRVGVSTNSYSKRIIRDYAEQDARNRVLGIAGEEAVLECERNALVACGRADLAKLVLHVAKLEGDGAGYDIKSYTPEGKEKFIEVKTTRGDKGTAFYLSSNEARFGADHADSYYLYRVFEFDQITSSGKVFLHHGPLQANFTILPIQFKVQPAFNSDN